MSAPPLRRRDRQADLERRYYGQSHGYNAHGYYASPSPPRSQRPEKHGHHRHKSERHRPPTPEYDHAYEPRPHQRRHHRKRSEEPHDQYHRPRIVNPPPPSSRQPSPPAYTSESLAPEVSRRDRDRRARHRSPPPRAPSPPIARPSRYASPPYDSDPRTDRGSRHSSQYNPPPEPRARGRRERPSSPSPRDRRSRDRDYYGHPHQSYPYEPYDISPPPRQRNRSRPPVGYGRPDGSPTRSRPPPAKASRARHSSMPAFVKPRAKQMWKSPMVQAGARNALTAGTQAVLNSRDETGPWMGAKGAKVASAALSAAVMDGILGGGKG